MLALLLVAAAWPVPAAAGGFGSPSNVLKKGQWTFGADGGAVSGRDIQDGSTTGTAVWYHGAHSRGFGLTEWLSVYGMIGGAKLEIKDSPVLISGSDTHDFGGALLVGAQLSGRLWHSDAHRVDWTGSVKFVQLHSRHDGGHEGDWNELQVATTLARAFGRLKPYLGVKASVIDFDYKLRSKGEIVARGTYEEEDFLGVIVGLDYQLGVAESLVINLESAFINGAEVDVAVTYLF